MNSCFSIFWMAAPSDLRNFPKRPKHQIASGPQTLGFSITNQPFRGSTNYGHLHMFSINHLFILECLMLTHTQNGFRTFFAQEMMHQKSIPSWIGCTTKAAEGVIVRGHWMGKCAGKPITIGTFSNSFSHPIGTFGTCSH